MILVSLCRPNAFPSFASGVMAFESNQDKTVVSQSKTEQASYPNTQIICIVRELIWFSYGNVLPRQRLSIVSLE